MCNAISLDYVIESTVMNVLLLHSLVSHPPTHQYRCGAASHLIVTPLLDLIYPQIPIAAHHNGRMAAVVSEGSADRGWDPQGRGPRRCNTHSGHRAPRESVVLLASRTQTHVTVRTPRQRENHDPVLGPTSPTGSRGNSWSFVVKLYFE